MKVLRKLLLSIQQKICRQTLARRCEKGLLVISRDDLIKDNENTETSDLAVVYDFVINTILKFSPSSGQALDVYCGPAQLMLKTAQAMPDMHFTGIDRSLRMLTFAAENKKRAGVTNAEFQPGNIFDIDPAFHKKFDLITWNFSMHHCQSDEDVMHALNAIFRCLKEKGTLIVFDYTRPKTGKMALELAELSSQPMGSLFFQDNLDSYKAAFSFEELEEIIMETDFVNWEHIQPRIANFFQVIMVTSTCHSQPRTVSHLKSFWQKAGYLFLKLAFAGRI